LFEGRYVRACTIPRRTPNPTTSLNYFLSPTEFANRCWKIHSYIPSGEVLWILYNLIECTQGLWYNFPVYGVCLGVRRAMAHAFTWWMMNRLYTVEWCWNGCVEGEEVLGWEGRGDCGFGPWSRIDKFKGQWGFESRRWVVSSLFLTDLILQGSHRYIISKVQIQFIIIATSFIPLSQQIPPAQQHKPQWHQRRPSSATSSWTPCRGKWRGKRRGYCGWAPPPTCFFRAWRGIFRSLQETDGEWWDIASHLWRPPAGDKSKSSGVQH